MFKNLKAYIKQVKAEVTEIPDDRKAKLREIADYVRTNDPARLIFICTHNSRRSIFCQVWSSVMGHYFEINHLESYSGGTEATAFNPRSVAAVRRAGFKILDPGGENPRYRVHFDDQEDPLVCFSKSFDDLFNPQKDFAAVMTCSHADQNCPFVPGASLRVSIPYVDPKESDGTDAEAETYDERCRQIATEMCYMLSQV